MNRHHKLLEELGHLKDRERVLIGENGQLRAQLVERKEQEKKKYDALLVEYCNIKQEYEDEGLNSDGMTVKEEIMEEIKEEDDYEVDKQGTSNNQVTVKTEWDHEEVKVEIKEEIKEEEDDEEEDHDIFIKREYVPAFIKTESSDVKVEIIEEDDDEDHDDDCECDRFVVKKEEVSDDDDNSMQLKHPLNEVVQANLNQPMDTSSRDQLHTPIHSVCTPSSNEPMQLTNSSVTEQSVDQQVMAANDDQLSQSSRVLQSSDAQANMEQVMSHENGSGQEQDLDGGDEMANHEGSVVVANEPSTSARVTSKQSTASTAHKLNKRKQSQPNRTDKRSKKSVEVDDDGEDGELSNSANDNHDRAVVASNEPSTSARPRSNRVTAKQSTASTARKLNKRKKSQPNRTDKRSKKTGEVDDGGEDGDDIGSEVQDEAKIKVLHLNCTQSNCNVKLDSLDHLHDHLSTVHQLAPIQCFAQNCNARFDVPRQIGHHIKLNHPQSTQFLCVVCPKKFDSQTQAYKHWYHHHLTGQFQCNFGSDCAQLTDTRNKMRTHQKTKHEDRSKHLHCTHPGCTVSFTYSTDLKRHQLIHLATNQFHCNWPHCSQQCKQRGNLVTHIRTHHFGLPQTVKEQKAKNIVDLRDPNEYVRVVVDE